MSRWSEGGKWILGRGGRRLHAGWMDWLHLVEIGVEHSLFPIPWASRFGHWTLPRSCFVAAMSVDDLSFPPLSCFYALSPLMDSFPYLPSPSAAGGIPVVFYACIFHVRHNHCPILPPRRPYSNLSPYRTAHPKTKDDNTISSVSLLLSQAIFEFL